MPTSAFALGSTCFSTAFLMLLLWFRCFSRGTHVWGHHPKEKADEGEGFPVGVLFFRRGQ